MPPCPDEDHDERRQPGARVRLPPAAERRRRPRAARVHHQPQHRRASEGAARVRPAAGGPEAARSGAASRATRVPTEFYVEKLAEGIATIAAAFCAEAGDRAAVGLQVERVLEPDRRRALRAARGEPDARLPRRVALRRRRVPRVLRARVPGAASACATTWGFTNVEIMVPFVRTRARGRAGHRAAREERAASAARTACASS